MKDHDSHRSKRLAQHALATDVLRLVHGDEIAEKARNEHSRLFPSRSGYITPPIHGIVQKERIEQTFKEASDGQEDQASSDSPSTNITLPQSLVFNRPVAHVLFHARLVNSRSEGHRLCAANGAYVGVKRGLDKDRGLQWNKVDNKNRGDAGKFVLDGNLLFLRAGKTKVRVVTITSDEDFEARGLSASGWKVGHNQEDNSA